MLQFILYDKYIKGTDKDVHIKLVNGLLCKIKPSILLVLNETIVCQDDEVFLGTKALKHIYDRHLFDKKNEGDFENILYKLTEIIKKPDEIRRNKKSKRGDLLFIKKIDNRIYLVSLEITSNGLIEVTTATITGRKYIKKFTLLWS